MKSFRAEGPAVCLARIIHGLWLRRVMAGGGRIPGGNLADRLAEARSSPFPQPAGIRRGDVFWVVIPVYAEEIAGGQKAWMARITWE